MKDYTEDANKLAKDLGLSEPDWMRKIVVKIYLIAAKKVYQDLKGDIDDQRRKETSKNCRERKED